MAMGTQPIVNPKLRGRPQALSIYGWLIRERREGLGLSRGALARQVGVTPRTIRRAENSQRLSLQVLRSLSEYLGLPLHSLIASGTSGNDVMGRLP
jgi:transcriptional regulator with XRE-family HTH domain